MWINIGLFFAGCGMILVGLIAWDAWRYKRLQARTPRFREIPDKIEPQEDFDPVLPIQITGEISGVFAGGTQYQTPGDEPTLYRETPGTTEAEALDNLLEETRWP